MKAMHHPYLAALLLTMSEGTVGAHRHHGKARLAKWAREHRWLH